MAIPKLLYELLTTPGPSGREEAPAAVWRKAAAEFATVTADTLGSSIAHVPGHSSGPRLALLGHIDEIGLMISYIEQNGFLCFVEIGGWDPQVLVGQRVSILTASGHLPGVIGRKPIHLQNEHERTQVQGSDAMRIDIGARSAVEAAECVRVGDVAVISDEPVELCNGRLASRALDNRIGAVVVLQAARQIAAAGGAAGDVMAIANVQEEGGVGLNGARTTVHAIRPDIAIVVDGTFATDEPGVRPGHLNSHGLGSGAEISRGTVLHPRLVDLLQTVAGANGIQVTEDAVAGPIGNDIHAVLASRDGIPTGLVSVPMRSMHTPVEVVDPADIEAAANLLTGFALHLDAETSFVR